MRTLGGEMVTVKSLNYNTSGPFVELLKSMEKQQNRFVLSAYMDILLTSGGVSPNAINGMIDYYDHLDIDDPLDKLLLAVHYIIAGSDPIRVKGNPEKQE